MNLDFGKEFNIKSRKESFRFKSIDAVSFFTLSQMILSAKKDDFNTNRKSAMIILENTEVKIKESWLPVKEKDKDVYWPADIQYDIVVINEIINKFVENYIYPAFHLSRTVK